MTPYEVFVNYLGLKRHFSDWTYDFERFGPMRNVRPDALESRPDYFRFRTLSSRPFPIWTMVAVLARNEQAWVGDMTSEDGVEIRDRSMGRIEAISKTLEAEVPLLDRDMFSTLGGRHPSLVRAVLSGRVSHETAAILVGLSGITRRWRDVYEGDPLMESMTRRLTRYFPLMPIDRKRVTSVLLDVINKKRAGVV